MSLASRRWGLADGQRQILPDGPCFVKNGQERDVLVVGGFETLPQNNRLLHRQALHLPGGVFGPLQAAVASQELHGLEESRAHGAPGDGKA